MGLRFSCVARGWGGSQEWAVALLGVHTPSKKRAQFHGYKHTSLISFVDEAGESSRFRGFFAQKMKFAMLC
jgi:hypothetical protein